MKKKIKWCTWKDEGVSLDSIRYDVIEWCSKISDPKTLDIGVKN